MMKNRYVVCISWNFNIVRSEKWLHKIYLAGIQVYKTYGLLWTVVFFMKCNHFILSHHEIEIKYITYLIMLHGTSDLKWSGCYSTKIAPSSKISVRNQAKFSRDEIQIVPPIWGHVQTHFFFFFKPHISKSKTCFENLHGAIFFLNLRIFFDIQFKNTFNLILLSFKVPSKRFCHKVFKTGLTFWNMWF